MSVYSIGDQSMHENVFRHNLHLAPSPANSYDSDSNVAPATGYLVKKHNHHPTPAAFTAPPSPSYYDYPSQPPYKSPSESSSSYSTPEPAFRETDDYEEHEFREESSRAHRGFQRYKKPVQQLEEVTRLGWNTFCERGSPRYADHHYMSPSPPPPPPPPSSAPSLPATRTDCMAIGSLLLASGPPAVVAEKDKDEMEVDRHVLINNDKSGETDDNPAYQPDASYRPPFAASIVSASPYLPQLTSSTSSVSSASSASSPTTPTSSTASPTAAHFAYPPFRHRESSVRAEDRSCGSLSPQLTSPSYHTSSPHHVGASFSPDRAALAALDSSLPRLFSRSERQSARKPVAFRSPAPIADTLLVSFQDASIAFHQEMSPRKCLRKNDDDDDDVDTVVYPHKHFMYTPRVLSGSLVYADFHKGTPRKREFHSVRESEELSIHNQPTQHQANATKGVRRVPQAKQYVARRSHLDNYDEGRRRRPRGEKEERFARTTLDDLAEAAGTVSPRYDNNDSGRFNSRSPYLPSRDHSRDRSPVSASRLPAKHARATSRRPPHTLDADSSRTDAESEVDELGESDYEGTTRLPVTRVKKPRGEGRVRVEGGRQGKTRGPCQACGDAKDTCIRKGYDWPFPVSEPQIDSKGIKFVSLCNKCGLRWQKSKCSICHYCKWILFKEERKKAVQCVDRMRRSRPVGEPLDPEEEIEGFICSPKGWPCGRLWKVGWIRE